MKATSVKELSSFLTDTMSGVPGEDKMPEGDSFSSIMETAAKNNTASTFANTQTTSTRTFELNVQKTGTRTGSEGRSADSVNENGRANGNKADSRKGPDRKETGDRIQETAEKVTKELKEKLGVSDEEIEETLSSLGLTMADLLNPSDLTAVYAALTGEGGAMDVLTDESLYAGLSEILSDLQTLTDDLKAQLGLTDEQLKETVEAFGVSDPVIEETDEDDTLEISSVSEEDTAAAKEDGLTEDVKVSTDHSKSSGTKNDKESRNYNDSASHDDMSQNGIQSAYQQNESTEVITDETNVTRSTYTSRQASEIARQLVEQIRINVSAQTTSLDMMLNPASLGHVALNIELKNGALTATFTAQNEAVRQVIESQMMILQENLESQGIKIEAVEVTVSNQAFDESLEQNRQDERSREEASNAVRASGRRMRINLLSNDGEENEELTEEEEINKDMMIRNGNSMDVTA